MNKRARYSGIGRPDLVGKTALIRLVDDDWVEIQLDDMEHDFELAHGWHKFPAGDWEIIPRNWSK